MQIGNQQKVSKMESTNRPKRIEAPKPNRIETPEVQPVEVTAEAERLTATATA